jgi:hypothetical protein
MLAEIAQSRGHRRETLTPRAARSGGLSFCELVGEAMLGNLGQPENRQERHHVHKTAYGPC